MVWRQFQNANFAKRKVVPLSRLSKPLCGNFSHSALVCMHHDLLFLPCCGLKLLGGGVRSKHQPFQLWMSKRQMEIRPLGGHLLMQQSLQLAQTQCPLMGRGQLSVSVRRQLDSAIETKLTKKQRSDWLHKCHVTHQRCGSTLSQL